MDEYRGTVNIKRGGSLDVTMDQGDIDQIRAKQAQDAANRKRVLVDKLTGTELPAGRLEEIKAYAANLHKKYPNWNAGRVASHTAAYFRLKLSKK